jgi:hypothetical protein
MPLESRVVARRLDRSIIEDHPDRAMSCFARPLTKLVLPVTDDDDDDVVGVDEYPDVRTAPLGVVSGAVVGVVTGCPSG